MLFTTRPTAPNRRRCGRVTLVLTAVATIVTGAAQFGATASGAVSGGHRPAGYVDVVYQDGVGVHVKGWAYDPDTSASAKVKLSVDGKMVATVIANADRPGVAVVHPSFGESRGFDVRRSVAVGRHTVCAYVVNYPSTQVTLLRCRTIVVRVNPIGTIRSLTQTPGFLRASGWAFDPDVSAPARTVSILVDGATVSHGLANRPFAGLGKTYPGVGNNHGYSLTFPIAEGAHNICAKVVNAGKGVTTIVKCVTHTVSFSPTGRLTALHEIAGGVKVAGYATDPDTTAPISVTITADGLPIGTIAATDADGAKPGYGFHGRVHLPAGPLKPGLRTICAVGVNAGAYGKNRALQCIRRSFNWNPAAGIEKLAQKSPGATITGWASDPDTPMPIGVKILADGKQLTTVTANGTGGSHPGHQFTAAVTLPDGKHAICAVAINARFGSGNSAPACASIRLAFEPYGRFDSVARATDSTDVVATGWAIDPDSTAPVPVQVSVDGGSWVTAGTANLTRLDVARKYPGTGTAHGFQVSVAATDVEQQVCVRAVNILGGSGTTSLGCRIVDAVHPTAPSAPTGVGAIAGYGGARITWTAPTNDGGAPWSSYTITSIPGDVTMTVARGINATTLVGLQPSTTYTFSVVANNVAGVSNAGVSDPATTQKEPPAQTSPAPISTSRYIRNLRGSSSAEQATMTKEGAADATANPGGHGYLILLDIGGQDESRGGVILSAGIRFVTYANLVTDIKAYIDGYASQQRPSAPITIAIGTNNDIDVSRSSGANWANKMVDPLAGYALRYPGITIAGANDIEPGFLATYARTRSWLQGYLASTRAPFVFNGSADGCAWTVTNRGCNNGWTMNGLFYLAGGANAIRILNLPQVYNSTMAEQWRFISLTGVQAGQPKINFGGALTEWTACQQAGGCGSLTGNNAWREMWTQLRSEPVLRPSSLPYSTDLRIDS